MVLGDSPLARMSIRRIQAKQLYKPTYDDNVTTVQVGFFFEDPMVIFKTSFNSIIIGSINCTN